jgi:Protein of unknown function (DUF2637)
MSDDRFLRASGTSAVLFVAAIAATVSFIHIRALAVTRGQTQLAAVLLPFSIDGTVVASSLVLLRAARHQMAAPWLAQVMLLSSVVATLAANVTYGAASGVIGALISGWPAYAFIGCAEMAIMMVRRTRLGPGTVPGRPPAPGTVPAVSPAVSAGGPRKYRKPGQRKIMTEVGVGQVKARAVQKLVASEIRAAASTNGHGA